AGGALSAFFPGEVGGSGDKVIGAFFVQFSTPALFLGLLFLVAVIRNETDIPFRNLLQSAVGGLGAVMIVVGLLGGMFSQTFLFRFGVILLPLGLAYLAAFIGQLEPSDERGFYAAAGLGLAGVAVFVIALFRSLLPLFSEAPDYLIPSGMVLMAVGLAFALISLAIWSDWTLIVMGRREVSTFFNSPVAYLLLVVVAAINLFMFWYFADNLVGPRPEPIVAEYFFALVPVILQMFVVPILTMRLFSEEKRSGTLEVLLTAPVNDWSI